MSVRLLLVIIALTWCPLVLKPWENEKDVIVKIVATAIMSFAGLLIFIAVSLAVACCYDFVIYGFLN